MASPRWRKLWRDVWLTRGRISMMVLALLVSSSAVGGILGAYAILTREIERNYRATRPASATLELDMIDPQLLAAVRQRPLIAAAEARATLQARVLIGDRWRPLLLFVIDDVQAMEVSTVHHEQGAWPPPDGTMLLERMALEVLGVEAGTALTVKTLNGAPTTVTISGVVHDPGLAPASQEGRGYGYITPATLPMLGESGTLDELKVIVRNAGDNRDLIEREAQDLAAWLQQQGRVVSEIQIPPPGRHPHQTQMVTLLVLLLGFSVMALILSAVLIGTMVAGLLAQQIRQIGAMKTLGARSGQLAGMYLSLILLISLVALSLGLLPGLIIGRQFAGQVAQMLNFTLDDQTIPWWVWAVQLTMGLIVPLVIATVPIRRVSRMTVYQAISDSGVRAERFGKPERRRWGRISRTLLLALRNTFRRRGRLILSISLLVTAGAIFLMALNVKGGWNALLASGHTARHYDLEVRLDRPTSSAALTERLLTLPEITAVEAWGYSASGLAQPNTIPVVATYPDGGHGSFSLRAPPPATNLVTFPVLAGRWLQPDDQDAVVLNQLALAQLPGIGVGDHVSLLLNGQATSWQVVGIVREIASPAAAYVPAETFAALAGKPGMARSFRIVTAPLDATAQLALLGRLDALLIEAGVNPELVMPDTELRTAMENHIVILINALIFMAAVIAVVGLLGLTSIMSTNVTERTREFGIMQTLGALPRTVMLIVLGEGIVIAAISWGLALVASLPLSAAIGGLVGNLAFRTPLPLVASTSGMLLWLGLVIIGTIGACAVPARRAARLTIRETLAYI